MSLEGETMKLEKQGGGATGMEEGGGAKLPGGRNKKSEGGGNDKHCVALFRLVGHKFLQDGEKVWNWKRGMR